MSSRRFAVIAVALLLASAVTATDAGSAQPADTSFVGNSQRAFSLPRMTSVADACQDVTVIGARGSGQDADDAGGLGAQVRAAFTTYASAVTGRRISYWPVNYPSFGVENIAIGKRKRYFQGLDVGIRDTLRVLKARHAMCPKERFVLAGYSQGAMVMHRVLWELTTAKIPFATIDALILIADGDRFARQGGVSLGSADAREGISWAGPARLAGVAFKPQRRDIPSRVASRFYSVCITNDIVCDTGPTSTWISGKNIHTKRYQTFPGVIGNRGAARRAATTTMVKPAVPPMTVSTNLANYKVGTPYTGTVTARGGTAPYAYALKAGQRMPPGLTLNASGAVTGTPTAAGTTVFRVRVKDHLGQVLWADMAMTGTAGTPNPPTSTDSDWPAIPSPPRLEALPRAYGKESDQQWAVLSHNGRYVLYMDSRWGLPGSGFKLQVLDRVRASVKTVLEPPGNWVYPLGVSDDGHTLLWRDDGTADVALTLWRQGSGALQLLPNEMPEYAAWGKAQLSADGTKILFSYPGLAALYDVSTASFTELPVERGGVCSSYDRGEIGYNASLQFDTASADLMFVPYTIRCSNSGPDAQALWASETGVYKTASRTFAPVARGSGSGYNGSTVLGLRVSDDGGTLYYAREVDVDRVTVSREWRVHRFAAESDTEILCPGAPNMLSTWFETMDASGSWLVGTGGGQVWRVPTTTGGVCSTLSYLGDTGENAPADASPTGFGVGANGAVVGFRTNADLLNEDPQSVRGLSMDRLYIWTG